MDCELGFVGGAGVRGRRGAGEWGRGVRLLSFCVACIELEVWLGTWAGFVRMIFFTFKGVCKEEWERDMCFTGDIWAMCPVRHSIPFNGFPETVR